MNPEEKQYQRDIKVSDNDTFMKFILATKLDLEENEVYDEELVESLRQILNSGKINILNISPLYIYLHRFHLSPNKYDDMIAPVALLFGKEKAIKIVSDIKSEHAFMHEVIKEHFSIKSYNGEYSFTVSKIVKNIPENLTEAEHEELLNLLADSYPEWESQDDWWTGNTNGINASPKGYDVNVVTSEFAKIEDDEVKVVLYALKERDKNDPDSLKYPLEADMNSEISSFVAKREDMQKMHIKNKENEDIPSIVQKENEEIPGSNPSPK